MKALHLRLAVSGALAVGIYFVLDAYFPWYANVLKNCLANVIVYPIALIFPTGLNRYLFSSGTVGAGFNFVIYLGINFPTIWQVASNSILSSSQTQVALECPPGMVIHVKDNCSFFLCSLFFLFQVTSLELISVMCRPATAVEQTLSR